jgi:acyl-coenzyme A thioesterase PaaI-like protein
MSAASSKHAPPPQGQKPPPEFLEAAAHPDFQQPWIQDLLSRPETFHSYEPEGAASSPPPPQLDDHVDIFSPATENSMFNRTLKHEQGIRAELQFWRPSTEPDAYLGVEKCYLVSVGDGLDGKGGRCHGGFNALILDQICGTCAHESNPDHLPPATATMTVDYRATVDTPCVVLCRAWMLEIEGRKMWVRGVIEDGQGNLKASAKCLFIRAVPKEAKL